MIDKSSVTTCRTAYENENIDDCRGKEVDSVKIGLRKKRGIICLSPLIDDQQGPI